MSKAEILAELPKLPPGDLREILRRIIELQGDDWLDNDELTAEEKATITQRLAEHAADPASAIPWSEAKAHLIQRFGE